MPSGSTLLYGAPQPRSFAIKDEVLRLAPCWGSVEDIVGRVEIIVAAEDCFIDMGTVRRSMQEVVRRSGSRFGCLERILQAISRAYELMYRRDTFLFSFSLVDLESTNLYLDQERFDGLYMKDSERIEAGLRRFIEDPSAQGDVMSLIEIRASFDR